MERAANTSMSLHEPQQISDIEENSDDDTANDATLNEYNLIRAGKYYNVAGKEMVGSDLSTRTMHSYSLEKPMETLPDLPILSKVQQGQHKGNHILIGCSVSVESDPVSKKVYEQELKHVL